MHNFQPILAPSAMIESLVDRAWSCLFDRDPPEREAPQSGPPHLGAAERENVDAAFREMLAELDLSEEKQQELMAHGREWKCRMLAERERTKRSHSAALRDCESALRQLAQHFPDAYGAPLAVQQLESLAASLRTETLGFVQQFLLADGLSLLVGLLNECHSRGPSAEQLALPALSCIRALLNSTIGSQCVHGSAESLRSVAWALDFQSARCKALSLEILSGLCVATELGHRSVLRALSEAKPLLGERTRFQRIVDDLHRDHGQTARETDRVRVGLMALVNALLKSGPALHSLEFRLHLRHEFLMLGILQVLERLRANSPEGDGSALGDHLDLFEMMRQEDEQEMQSLSDSGSASPIDFESPSGMAEVLAQRLDNTLALPHLISLLQHLLMVPTDERHLPLWRLFDLVLQQLALQSAMGGLCPLGADPQFAQQPLQLDMAALLDRLRTQQDYEQMECRLRQSERELEAERRRVLELENRLSDLQDGCSLVSFSRVSEHSAASSSPSDPCHSPPPFGPTPSSLPPIRPPVGMAPPPPPPSALQLRSIGAIPSTSSVAQKKVPKPSCALRTLNWTSIGAEKIKGTVWEQIEEEKLYQHIDLAELCERFAAARGSGDENGDGGMGTISGRGSRAAMLRLHQEQLISVIEPRRAQNCTIMLSRLKLSHREIRHTVLSMDERGRLPRDMVEQMLKFAPTREELSLIRDVLSQHRKSPSALALADRFLWEMGQIPRYEQRLKCLFTIRSFQDRVGELRPTMAVVDRASAHLSSSKRLRQFLAVVLAVGNVLNRGKRSGNAFGFTVPSLEQIPSVRCSNRPERNLMHFLAELAERKFPDLLRLKRELEPIQEASRVNRAELEAEIRLLDVSIRELASELGVQEKVEGTAANGGADKRHQPAEDRFVPVVRAFLQMARKEMADVQREHDEMAEKFSKCTRFFCALDAKKGGNPSPDAFFGTFARCLNTFGECYAAIWAEREEAERTKRQTLARTTMLSRKNGRQRAAVGTLCRAADRDFESLVSMLQSGELFSEHLGRLRHSVRASAEGRH